MKTVGIIGGLGPETTSEFYLELSFLCQKIDRSKRPPILIFSVPIPYDIEESAIARGENEELCIPLLIEAAQKLEAGGADFIVLLCNSLHAFIDKIRKAVQIPVLSIVEESTKFLKANNINKVGLLATAITSKRKVYESYFNSQKIEIVKPDDFEQAKLGKIIHNLVMNKHTNRDREVITSIIDNFENKGVENIILACTDLQLLLPSHPKLKIFDTMKIFAKATANKVID